MSLGFHPVSRIQRENNDFLREGVEGVTVTLAGKVDELKAALSPEQKNALEDIQHVSLSGQHALSGIEVYANGAMNIFIKEISTGEIVEYARYRP